MAGQEGLVLDALGGAHAVGPLPQLVKAGTQAVHHHVIFRHAHELLHLAAHTTQITSNTQYDTHHMHAACDTHNMAHTT